MPTYRIKVINGDFTASEERELPDAEAARQEAIRGAIAMGADHVCASESLFGAEVSIGEGDQPRRRFVVTVSASELNS